ncbi:MAG: sulfurtransferase [Planctomycetales bacterium]|nr:sulfurtransferase [Planctomycetales bacterium]
MPPSSQIDVEILNIAAYHFVPLDELAERRAALLELCRHLDLRGTILLAPEGINLFLAGTVAGVEEFLATLKRQPEFTELVVKRSYSRRQPFRRLLVRLKKEIIAFGVPEVDPHKASSPKLSPETLKQWLDEGRDIELLDVRNDYEIEVGTFVGATAIGLGHFRDFPAATAQLPESWKQKPVVMFCTGGIRCEKAGPFMEQQGFEEVYQLDGGILNYFELCGGAHYRGDCFVFDHRVALAPDLSETEHAMCFTCQAVLTKEEQLSPMYVPGVCCPFCYQSDAELAQERLEHRRASIEKFASPLPGAGPYDSARPIRVPDRVDRMTLLDAVDTLFPYVGRGRWQKSCDEGRITEAGRALAADEVVRAGQQLQHVEPNVVEPPVNPNIEVLYEDDDLIVVNKPAPLPMHPCGRFNRNTLVWMLDQVYAPEKVRCAHRLDANTSGLVVLTRRRSAASVLQPKFERGEVRKTYLARVLGVPEADEFRCDVGIAQEVGPAGLRGWSEDGLPAETHFKVLRRWDCGELWESLLEVRPITGRTNQIRIHAWKLDLPIVGDPSYLPHGEMSATQTRDIDSAPMCLHAWRLEFAHPTTQQVVRFEAPAPDWAKRP